MGLGWGKLYVTIVRRLCFFAVKIASQLFLRLAVKIVTAIMKTWRESLRSAYIKCGDANVPTCRMRIKVTKNQRKLLFN